MKRSRRLIIISESWNKIKFILIFLIVVSATTSAQVSTYNFMQGVFTDQSQYYVPVNNSPNQYYAYSKILSSPNPAVNPLKILYTGGDTGVINNNDASGEGYPIGFNFIYNNESFDRLVVSGNGYIKLGHSGQQIIIKNDSVSGAIFDGSVENQNIIASFQTSSSVLFPNNNPPLLFMYGLPGNRTFIIQFTYVTESGILLIHQIQLMEKKNIIGFAYPSGGYDFPNTFIQGAIGFTSQSDFTNLQITSGINNWQTATQGTLSTNLCDFKNTIAPPGVCCTNQSYMYIWTPPVPAPSNPDCPFTYFLFSDTTHYNPSNKIMYGGATTAYSTSTYYVLANGATIAPNNPTLSWSDESVSSHQTTTYDVYLDTDNPPLNSIVQNVTGTSFTLPLLAPNTKYYYNVVSKNSSGKDSICIGSFITDSMLQYCQTGSQGDAYINYFNLNSLSFTLTADNRTAAILPALSPYTTILKRDTTYTCSVTLIGQHPYPGNPWSNADVRVWIDFNQDGDFDDPGEAIAGGSGGVNSSFTFNISIPNTAKLGKTIMRMVSKNVAALESFAPCSTYSDGGNQDFIITIGPSTACENFILNPAISNIVCHGQNNGNINLNLSGGDTPYDITWADGSITSETRNNLSKGIYQASILDANNCQVNTPLIAIIQPSYLQVDTTTSNKIIYFLSSGGTAPYRYLWSNGDTLSNSSNLTEGSYSVTITDAHSCDTTIENIIINAGSIIPPPPVDSLKDSAVNIIAYPNPANQIIYLKSQIQQTIQVEILNEQGKLIQNGNYSININNAASINIASFANGIYFVKVVGDKSTAVVKVIKNNQ
jgi:hypothetical protein